MEKKQTAVEWIVDYIKNLEKYPYKTIQELEDQAKQMEKEQKQECWYIAHQVGRFEGKGIAEENWQTFEQYYNETYE